MDHPIAPRQRLLLSLLFLVQAHAIALWFVPFSAVLTSKGLGDLTPWAFATGAVAAFVSPMLTGVLADRHLSATILLRFLSLGMAVFLTLTFAAIEAGCERWVVLLLLQGLQLCSAPTWGVASMLVLSQLPDPSRQFGSLRVWGTFGWMLAGPMVSLVLDADGSTKSGFAAALAWLGVAGLTCLLPRVPPQAEKTPVTWGSLFGVETFAILRVPRHRSLFFTAALLSIPLAAFYPYTPLQLHELGWHRVSAVMALGQVFEAVSMCVMGRLLTRFSLRTLFLTAISAGVLRYVAFASHEGWAVVVGILLHGVCFTLFFIPAQIYVESCIPRELRFRAQALMTLLISGFGNLAGFLGCGALKSLCSTPVHTNWPLFWWVLAGAVVAVGGYFWATFPSETKHPAE